eukprot:TRINITY_DN20179_c0_g1_i1.p1 TRINITY_DN20179_c0_g1~~TRINITY_DN20179_c0_g1_i1.p1  ORF type:complete len:853 (+),score=119.48 TRINITY_DN20179_c0_g1_i1:174-2732(+)
MDSGGFVINLNGAIGGISDCDQAAETEDQRGQSSDNDEAASSAIRVVVEAGLPLRLASFSQGSSSSGSRVGEEADEAEVGEDLTSYLPGDCLALAFKRLDQVDLGNCSLACRRWYKVDAESRSHLVLRATEEIVPVLPKLLTRFSGVTKLVLKCQKKVPSINDAGLLTIAERCPQLRKLKLKHCNKVTDAGLEAFAAVCKDLRKFSCGNCGFGGRGLNALLQNCSLLEDLTVKRTNTKASQERVPEPLQPNRSAALRRLCLKDQGTFHAWIGLISGSPRLETLILARNLGNWDRLLETALGSGKLKELSQIYLERVNISDRGLRAIAQCHKLEALVVVKAPECTEAGLSLIAHGCPGLLRLHVEGWQAQRMGDVGLLAVATQCRQLQELVLVSNAVTEVSLTPLATLALSLERLTLCASETVGDPEVAILARGCPALRRLCIKGCPRVANLGIIALANGCPSLQKLKIRRCGEVTADTIAFLKQMRPEVQVQLERKAGGEEDADAEVEREEGRLQRRHRHPGGGVVLGDGVLGAVAAAGGHAAAAALADAAQAGVGGVNGLIVEAGGGVGGGVSAASGVGGSDNRVEEGSEATSRRFFRARQVFERGTRNLVGTFRRLLPTDARPGPSGGSGSVTTGWGTSSSTTSNGAVAGGGGGGAPSPGASGGAHWAADSSTPPPSLVAIAMPNTPFSNERALHLAARTPANGTGGGGEGAGGGAQGGIGASLIAGLAGPWTGMEGSVRNEFHPDAITPVRHRREGPSSSANPSAAPSAAPPLFVNQGDWNPLLPASGGGWGTPGSSSSSNAAAQQGPNVPGPVRRPAGWHPLLTAAPAPLRRGFAERGPEEKRGGGDR